MGRSKRDVTDQDRARQFSAKIRSSLIALKSGRVTLVSAMLSANRTRVKTTEFVYRRRMEVLTVNARETSKEKHVLYLEYAGLIHAAISYAALAIQGSLSVLWRANERKIREAP